MKRLRKKLIYIVAGFVFWLPSVVFHAFRGYQFGESRFDIIGITIMPVVTSLLALELLARKMRDISSRGVIALCMLLGIWMLGPLFTMLGASFSGGGFAQPGTSYLLLTGIVLFVPYTFMMSTYDGTLGALGVITILFILVGIISLTIRWKRTRHSRAAQL